MMKSTSYSARKATSQSVWIIMAIVVALTVVLLLIMFMNSTTGKVKGSTDETMGTAGNTLKENMCSEACKTCKRIYDDCPSRWPSISEDNGCAGIAYECA